MEVLVSHLFHTYVFFKTWNDQRLQLANYHSGIRLTSALLDSRSSRTRKIVLQQHLTTAS